jgi:hypothetical protein
MKVIIAGSRDIWRYDLVEKAVEESGFDVTTVVCGMAFGIDNTGWAWAYINGVPIAEFPADWDYHGKSAGPIRNDQMAKYADALIAITNGSNGTAHMIKVATAKGLKVYVLNV